MEGTFPVRVTVLSQRGKCSAEHKVGDSWLVQQNLTPGGICMGAFNAIAPYVRTFRYGGEHPWSQDKDVTTVACPDAENPLVFEVRRLRQG